MPVCLSVSLCVCLSVCLFVCVFVTLVNLTFFVYLQFRCEYVFAATLANWQYVS